MPGATGVIDGRMAFVATDTCHRGQGLAVAISDESNRGGIFYLKERKLVSSKG
jgi:hypothetical protein